MMSREIADSCKKGKGNGDVYEVGGDETKEGGRRKRQVRKVVMVEDVNAELRVEVNARLSLQSFA